MVRMLVHAGFHKTGTTSVQNMLSRNKRLLTQHTHIFQRKHFPSVCEHARAYSVSRKPYDLVGYTQGLREFFQTLEGAFDRHVCISSEDLVGHMPGRRNITSYEAAPMLMKAFVHTAEKILPDEVELVFYFSVREPEGWLRSCHSQHLRTIKMDLTSEEYAEAFRDSARLGRIVDMVRIAVAPHRVEWASLECTSDSPLGPLTPILDILEIPQDVRDQIQTFGRANPGLPQELRDEFLRINRLDIPHREAQAAKQEARKLWKQAQSDPQS